MEINNTFENAYEVTAIPNDTNSVQSTTNNVYHLWTYMTKEQEENATYKT